MPNAFELRCPECHSSDHIDIAATVWVRVTQDGTDAAQSHDGAHHWNDDSLCRCDACGELGTVLNFSPEDEDGPHVGERAACHLCGQDIEWTGDDWRDRGGNRQCVPYTERGEIVQPPEGALHAPAVSQLEAERDMPYPPELARADHLLSAEELFQKYATERDNGEHPRHLRRDWRHDVAEDNTLLGYWQWVVSQIEEED